MGVAESLVESGRVDLAVFPDEFTVDVPVGTLFVSPTTRELAEALAAIVTDRIKRRFAV